MAKISTHRETRAHSYVSFSGRFVPVDPGRVKISWRLDLNFGDVVFWFISGRQCNPVCIRGAGQRAGSYGDGIVGRSLLSMHKEPLFVTRDLVYEAVASSRRWYHCAYQVYLLSLKCYLSHKSECWWAIKAKIESYNRSSTKNIEGLSYELKYLHQSLTWSCKKEYVRMEKGLFSKKKWENTWNTLI